MKVVNQVNETSDYTMFRTLEGNRHVNKVHIRRLRESFQKAYLLSPIIVNEKFEIIDGQHRFEAAKQVGLPINFMVTPNYGLREVQMLNENMKNWKKEDYLNAYCDLKEPVYLQFKNFMKRFSEFGISGCEIILTNRLSGNQDASSPELISETNARGRFAIRYFQEGGLIIPDYEKSVENAEKIIEIKPFYNGFNRPTFIRAMIGIFKIEHYNHAKFLAKLKVNPTMIKDCTNVTQYKLMIEDIYNFRSKEKVSLRF